MRAGDLIRIKRSRISLRVPNVGDPRRWERRIKPGVWFARSRQFGCPREFRPYLRTPAERAQELGVSEGVLTRFVTATDTPVLTADYILFGPHRWYVTACRRCDGAGLSRPALDESMLRTGQMLFAEHTFELAVFDIYVKRNALGIPDRDIYRMVQKLTGALRDVAAEAERKRLAPPRLNGGRQQQFAVRSAARMRTALEAGHLRAVEATYWELWDLFERELASVTDEIGARVFPSKEDVTVIDPFAMVAVVEAFVAKPRPRGPRRKESALDGRELLRAHYCHLTGERRKTPAGDFGVFVEAVFRHFGVAVPGADIGRTRIRRG